MPSGVLRQPTVDMSEARENAALFVAAGTLMPPPFPVEDAMFERMSQFVICGRASPESATPPPRPEAVLKAINVSRMIGASGVLLDTSNQIPPPSFAALDWIPQPSITGTPFST